MTKPETRDLSFYDDGIPIIDSLLEQQFKTFKGI